MFLIPHGLGIPSPTIRRPLLGLVIPSYVRHTPWELVLRMFSLNLVPRPRDAVSETFTPNTPGRRAAVRNRSDWKTGSNEGNHIRSVTHLVPKVRRFSSTITLTNPGYRCLGDFPVQTLRECQKRIFISVAMSMIRAWSNSSCDALSRHDHMSGDTLEHVWW